MYMSDLFAAYPAEAKDCVGKATGFASSASGSLVPKQKSKNEAETNGSGL
jgi:hypothetical protein